MNAESIQALIHKLEVAGGARRLNFVALTVAVLSLAIWYDLHCYRNFATPEAMDAAQVALAGSQIPKQQSALVAHC